MEKGFLLDFWIPGDEVEVVIRGGISKEKNGLFIETQMSSEIGRVFEVMSKYKVDISLFRGSFCFLYPFSKRL